MLVFTGKIMIDLWISGYFHLTHDKTHHKALSPLSSHKKLALRTQKNLIETRQNPWFSFFLCVMSTLD